MKKLLLFVFENVCQTTTLYQLCNLFWLLKNYFLSVVITSHTLKNKKEGLQRIKIY